MAIVALIITFSVVPRKEHLILLVLNFNPLLTSLSEGAYLLRIRLENI